MTDSVNSLASVVEENAASTEETSASMMLLSKTIRECSEDILTETFTLLTNPLTIPSISCALFEDSSERLRISSATTAKPSWTNMLGSVIHTGETLNQSSEKFSEKFASISDSIQN